MDIIIEFRSWMGRNLIPFLVVPILIISMICIGYGEVINAFLKDHPELFKLYIIQNQISLFTSDIDLPGHIKVLGYDSAVFILLLFEFWLVLNLIYSYYSLSRSAKSLVEVSLHTFLVIVLYVFVITPHLAFWMVFTGYIILSVNCVIILLYLLYRTRFNKK